MKEKAKLKKIERIKKEIDYYSTIYSPKSSKVKKLKNKLKSILENSTK